MIPPVNSARDLKRIPKELPILTPKIEQKKVIQPIKITAGRIVTFKNAKVIPTARASIDRKSVV